MKKKTDRAFFVTTALPYANGLFHIGHIMEYIQADIWVRAQRMWGCKVFFVGADDAHGVPIMLAADREGMPPEEFVKRISGTRQRYFNGFFIGFDFWHTTHSVENSELSQAIYLDLLGNDFVYKKQIQQFFDPQKQMFLPDRFIKGTCPRCLAEDQNGDSCEACGSVYQPTELISPRSTLSGMQPELRPSEHYFFKLSDLRCVDFLRKWIAEVDRRGIPRLQSAVKAKAQEWLSASPTGVSMEGKDTSTLSDWDISRDAPYFGISIPGAEGKFFYVWLDAPIGYLASLKALFKGREDSFEDFLNHPETEQVHFIGKDIMYFHVLFWPAILKFSNRKTPDRVIVHGFVTTRGEKMSKSRGTGISPLKYLELGLNPEWLRYYFSTKVNAKVEDLDFAIEDFVARVNGDLIGKYVNIASRSAGFLSKFFEGNILPIAEYSPSVERSVLKAESAVEVSDNLPLDGESISHLIFKFDSEWGREWAKGLLEMYELGDYARVMREVMSYANLVNQYFDSEKPWRLEKDPSQHGELHNVCSACLRAFLRMTVLLKPVLPNTAQQVERLFGLPDLCWQDVLSIESRLWKKMNMQPYTRLMDRVSREQLGELFV